MNINVEAIERGVKVFVQLGHLTAKHGLVVGHRITIVAEKPEVEYLVRWFSAGSRDADQEWFDERFVHLTAEAAFA